MEHHGFLTLLPTLLVFTLAILIKRPIGALVSGSVAGLLMLSPREFLHEFAERSVRVMTDEDVAWVILVCGFMGSLIGLLVRSGGTAAFTAHVVRVVRSQRSALLCTWALGLTPYVIEQVRPYMTAELLPMLVFLTMGLVSFATGSNWGVFVIVLPIVATLAREVGADMTLVVGATLSASTFGSHACFYSDATVLTSQASGCTSIQHAVTQLPYAVIAAAISALGYYLVA